MVEVNRSPFRHRAGEWVQANDGRVGVELSRQAGLVYRLRCGPGEFFYAQSQLRAVERPGRRAEACGGPRSQPGGVLRHWAKECPR
jgi:hypothetical protein